MSHVLERYQGKPQVDLLIGVPHRGFIDPKWYACKESIQFPPDIRRVITNYESGHAVDVARNLMISKALEAGARYVLFIDSDMVFSADALAQLMNMRLPIVSAAYMSRSEPYHVVANIGDSPVDPALLEPSPQNPEVIFVDEVGLGFCLIDTRALLNVGRNLNEWRCFSNHKKQIGTPVLVYDTETAIKNNFKCHICKNLVIARFCWSRMGMTNREATGEDYYLCYNFRQAGYKVALATRVFCNHLLTNVEVTRNGLLNTNSSVANARI